MLDADGSAVLLTALGLDDTETVSLSATWADDGTLSGQADAPVASDGTVDASKTILTFGP